MTETSKGARVIEILRITVLSVALVFVLTVAYTVSVWIQQNTAVAAGEGWEARSPEVKPEPAPGEWLDALLDGESVSLTLAVATATEGTRKTDANAETTDSDEPVDSNETTSNAVACEDPELGDVEQFDDGEYFVDFVWNERGCDDRGSLLTTIIFDDVEPAGLVLSFRPSAEALTCPRLRLSASGEVSAEGERPCPNLADS